MDGLTITIAGPPGSGKSMLAQLIADRLMVLHVPAEIQTAEVAEVNLSMRAQGERLESVIDRLKATGGKVKIRMATTRKGGAA